MTDRTVRRPHPAAHARRSSAALAAAATFGMIAAMSAPVAAGATDTAEPVTAAPVQRVEVVVRRHIVTPATPVIIRQVAAPVAPVVVAAPPSARAPAAAPAPAAPAPAPAPTSRSGGS